MSSMNVVVIVGNVGKMGDGSFAMSQDGMARLSFSVALNSVRKNNGTKEEKTSWVDVTAWGQLAQNLQPYITQGTKVAVRGKLEQQNWTDSQTGQARSKLVVMAGDIELISSKTQAPTNQVPQQNYQQNQYPQQNQQPMYNQVPQQNYQQNQYPNQNQQGYHQ